MYQSWGKPLCTKVGDFSQWAVSSHFDVMTKMGIRLFVDLAVVQFAQLSVKSTAAGVVVFL
jgi:hypothetical protein